MTVILSAKATDDVDEFVATITIAQWQAIARMVFTEQAMLSQL